MKTNKKVALYIVEDEKSAQFRYRVYNIIQLYKNDSEWSVEYRLADSVCNKKIISKVDLIVVERQSLKGNNVIKIIKEAHRQKKKVLFDLDDLVFDYRDLFLLMKSTNSKNVFYWVGYFWGIRRIAKKVDGFLCTNEFLGKKLKRSFKKPTKVILNSLNKEQVDISKKCLKEKKNKNKFIVGYFSGSPTHMKDFRMIESELLSFLKKHSDTYLLVVGYMDYSRQMKKMMMSGRVKAMKPVDYLELQKLMCGVDVNIAPLIINDFTNCKSELKFFEAAIVETTTIASPNYSFAHVINDGKDGFLAKKGEWMNTLEYLYQNELNNKKVAKKARLVALEKYYGSNIKRIVKEAYDFFVKP